MGVTRDRLLEELPYMNRALMRMPVTFYGEKSIQSGTKSPKFSEMPASFCGEELTAAGRAENEITVEESRTQERENTAGSENAGDDPIKKLPPGIGTDGRLVYADIDEVICAYRENRIRLSRTYLHMIFHCLFQHPFRCRRMDRRRWNFAADAAAEDAVLSLGIEALQMEDDWQLKAKLDLMKQAVGEPFTAERIYHYLRTHSEPFDVEHAAQNTSRQADRTQSDRTQSDRIQSDRIQSGRARGEDDFPDAWAEDASIFHRDIHEPWLFINDTMPEEVIRRGGEETGGKWRSISQGVQHDMEMHEKNQALEPGSLTKIFHLQYRKESTYTEFLKRFAKLTEDMHISSDEFDYIYYMYGLQLYGNVPLIEPLEYRETDRIRDFVIAIDTSGSCQDHVVQGFLQKTWDVMKNSGIFTGDLNLHIIQADAQVQRDDVIRSQEDFDLYMKDVEIKGSGGTDFRPVFQHVDELQRSGQFTHLQGLIYFTDGYGLFPQERPEYPTAFVFIRDQWEIPKVPAWAYQIVLNDTQFAGEEKRGGRLHL